MTPYNYPISLLLVKPVPALAAGPAIRSSEDGIATAVVVNARFYMVDFGLGCTRAAHEAGLRGKDLAAGFITHLHSNHVAELPAFLLFNWSAPVEGFTAHVPIHGLGPDPSQRACGIRLAGTREMVSSLMEAFT